MTDPLLPGAIVLWNSAERSPFRALTCMPTYAKGEHWNGFTVSVEYRCIEGGRPVYDTRVCGVDSGPLSLGHGIEPDYVAALESLCGFLSAEVESMSYHNGEEPSDGWIFSEKVREMLSKYSDMGELAWVPEEYDF